MMIMQNIALFHKYTSEQCFCLHPLHQLHLETAGSGLS